MRFFFAIGAAKYRPHKLVEAHTTSIHLRLRPPADQPRCFARSEPAPAADSSSILIRVRLCGTAVAEKADAGIEIDAEVVDGLDVAEALDDGPHLDQRRAAIFHPQLCPRRQRPSVVACRRRRTTRWRSVRRADHHLALGIGDAEQHHAVLQALHDDGAEDGDGCPRRRSATCRRWPRRR
jgi:hypothetical protein